jgi:O-antigen/teichoic acid export membrane protein
MPNSLSKSFKNLAKESLWVVVGQFVTLIGSLVLVRVVTSYLNPNEYGHLALSLTALGLVSQIAMNSVGASIGRFVPVAIEQNNLSDFASAAKQLLLISAAVSLTIGLVLATLLWLNQHGDWAFLCLLGFVYATVSLYNFTANTVQNAARNRATVAIHTSADTWLKVLFAVVTIALFGATAGSALVGYIFAVCLVLVSQRYFFKRFYKQNSHQTSTQTPSLNTTRPQTNWQHSMWQFAWPFATWGVFTWAQQVSDLWSLKAFTSTYEVGLYTVILQLGFAPIILFNTIVQVFLGPILNQRITRYQRHVHTVTWATTGLSLALTFFAFIFVLNIHEWLFGFLVAKEYRVASVYLPYMVLAGGLFSGGQILSLKLISELKSRRMIGVKIGTALLGLTLNIIGAWSYGTAGVVGAMIIFSFSYLISMAWLAKQTPQPQ